MDWQTAVVYLAAGYVFLINILCFFAFGTDKQRAKKGVRRIPESTLLTLCAVGGAAGAWLAMALFRHKTKHRRFSVGVPAILFGEMLFLIVYFIVML